MQIQQICWRIWRVGCRQDGRRPRFAESEESSSLTALEKLGLCDGTSDHSLRGSRSDEARGVPSYKFIRLQANRCRSTIQGHMLPFDSGFALANAWKSSEQGHGVPDQSDFSASQTRLDEWAGFDLSRTALGREGVSGGMHQRSTKHPCEYTSLGIYFPGFIPGSPAHIEHVIRNTHTKKQIFSIRIHQNDTNRNHIQIQTWYQI